MATIAAHQQRTAARTGTASPQPDWLTYLICVLVCLSVVSEVVIFLDVDDWRLFALAILCPLAATLFFVWFGRTMRMRGQIGEARGIARAADFIRDWSESS